MSLDQNQFDFIINHVFLPPKLPNGEEQDLSGLELELLRLVRSSAEQFVQQVSANSTVRWQPIVSMLQTWMKIIEYSDLDEEMFSMVLKSLEPNGR